MANILHVVNLEGAHKLWLHVFSDAL